MKMIYLAALIIFSNTALAFDFDGIECSHYGTFENYSVEAFKNRETGEYLVSIVKSNSLGARFIYSDEYSETTKRTDKGLFHILTGKGARFKLYLPIGEDNSVLLDKAFVRSGKLFFSKSMRCHFKY